MCKGFESLSWKTFDNNTIKKGGNMNLTREFRATALTLTFLIFFSSIGFCEANSKGNKKKPREITIKYNFDERKAVYSIDDKPDVPKPRLKKSDNVKLIAISKLEPNHYLAIEYEITGYDPETKFKDILSGALDQTEKVATTKPDEISQDVYEELRPGGTLTVQFLIRKKVIEEIVDGNTNTIKEHFVTDQKKIIKLRIKDEYPWFFTSTGFIFSNENNRELAIINTGETVTYEKDGKTVQAKQQMITWKNDNVSFKPKQTSVQFLNVRIYKFIYASIGVPLNKKIFSEPLFGITYFHRIKSVGAAFTFGIQFHKQLFTLESSVYEDDYIINPTDGLTVENIPTEEKYKVRPFIGLSFRF